MEGRIVSESACQRKALERLDKVAQSDAEILICGPSGVGKELFALRAHQVSRRRGGAFVAINCANLSPDMLENEIFGHAKGAFTGASTPAEGIAAAADGGTLFLDEVDALPLPCQAKVLRFAEQKEYRRLGENFVRRADIRLIAASNANLAQMVERGEFRQDLYYRLRVAPIEIAPLADRPEDVPVLLEQFIMDYAADNGGAPIVLTDAARRQMLDYHWPGNVRELQNCVRFLSCMRLGRPVVPADLPAMAARTRPASPARLLPPVSMREANSHDHVGEAELEELCERPMSEAKSAVVEAFERDYLDRALSRSNGNVAEAARRSGKNRRMIFQLLQKYGLSAGSYRWRE